MIWNHLLVVMILMDTASGNQNASELSPSEIIDFQSELIKWICL